jgi:RimJ/RimL family protein N-acetyltransferase
VGAASAGGDEIPPELRTERLWLRRWRPDDRGRGYAPEGARAVLEFGFAHVGVEEIVSFTAVPNLRSRRVMEKIGMVHRPADDFDHPLVPEGHWLRRHVLYRAAARPRRVPRDA